MSTPKNADSLPERIAFLRKAPIFAALNEAELTAIAGSLRTRRYGRGEVIFYEGDESRELYLLIEGKVRIFKTSPAGNETSLNIFSTYDILGEFATLDDQPRSATVKAITPCHLYQLSQRNFLQFLYEIPLLAMGIIKLLAAKARWAANLAETISQYDAAGRLLHLILYYNEQFGREIEPGKRYILNMGLTQADLASLVGARREWVNHLLRDWRKRGLIEHHEGQITILDLPRVKAERDSRIEANRADADG